MRTFGKFNSRDRFQTDETGSLTIFSLFLFMLILMMAGMAVDLLRHEHGRVAMQNTLDTAVLAASAINQDMDPETVVRNYVQKAGFDPDAITINATDNTVGGEVTSRFVVASANVTIDTIFMDMMGINELNGMTGTRAEEVSPKVEIALILDISGSMGWESATPNVTKLAALKVAAKSFIDTVFANNDAENVSISIVPYNHQVYLPVELRSRLSVNDTTVTVSPASPYTGAITEYQTSNPVAPCIVFDAVDYNTRQITDTGSVNLSGSFLQDSHNWWYNGQQQQDFEAPHEWAKWCNDHSPKVLPFSNDQTALKDHIDSLEARGWTAVNHGMKWGIALLDPTMRPILGQMVDAFERPAGMEIFPSNYGNSDTQKYAIVMTDGVNTTQYDLKPEFKSGPTRIWYSPSEGSSDSDDGYYVLMPDNSASERFYRPRSPYTNSDNEYAANLPNDAQQLDYHEIYQRFGMESVAKFFFENEDTAAYDAHMDATYENGGSTADIRTRAICDAAQANGGITVYTVAFEAPDAAAQLLDDCALIAGNYFDVEGTNISTAFSAIASQIALLRLTD